MTYSIEEVFYLPKLISPSKFQIYLTAMASDVQAALQLYEWNVQVSAAFMVPLSLCETATRTAIADVLEKVHGERWPWSTGFLRSLTTPRSAGDYDPRTDLVRTASEARNTGQVVFNLKYVFWEKLMVSAQDQRLWDSHLRSAFEGLKEDISLSEARANLYSAMLKTRLFRNKVAHLEPIFARDLDSDFLALKALLQYRSKHAAGWMGRMENVSQILQKKPALRAVRD